MTQRTIIKLARGIPASDGAGVKMTRVIGHQGLPDIDPFLLLDEFGSDKPGDYIAGFPNHPHRGFQTVTYMLDGRMRHKDNKGHEGVIGPGDVQWMNAGRGLVHSEMPEQEEGLMRGFQLWVNLPAKDKMSDPDYEEYAAKDIPVVKTDGGQVKIIAGDFDGVQGAVNAIAGAPSYLDVHLDETASVTLPTPSGHTAFVYVYEGTVLIGGKAVSKKEIALLSEGDETVLTAGGDGARAIFVANAPMNEPVARYGPFVMNTREEIVQAVNDFNAGRF